MLFVIKFRVKILCRKNEAKIITTKQKTFFWRPAQAKVLIRKYYKLFKIFLVSFDNDFSLNQNILRATNFLTGKT